ncbi:universal stress protein [uncultured Algibacter sp.]|uniref:universal stress protein n=1 Tax=uncultured Algibacter sp. TaxID=298659 RepID=UPI003216E04E
MKRVLIPIDFSENAWNATKYALDFFKTHPVTFFLIHIKPLDPFNKGAKSLNAHDKKVDKALDATKKRMLEASNFNENQIITDYIKSSFIEGVKIFVENNEIDLIVIGTKGASNRTNSTTGSHTYSIITKIKAPVLVIPNKAEFRVPFNIAFPTDYDIIYKYKVLATLTKIANVHQSNLKILRVANSKVDLTPFQLKNRTYLKDYLKNAPSSFHKVGHLEFEEDLQVFVDSMHIDIIAIIAKNLNFFQKLLFKPTVDKMRYRTQIPFLVLHE